MDFGAGFYTTTNQKQAVSFAHKVMLRNNSQTKAVIDINTCEVTEGNLPKKQLKLVLAWAELRKEELLADWTLAMNSELPFKIDPLK